MAITKTTNLISIQVVPHELEDGAPIVTVVLEDVWDDPDDDQLPIIKRREITRGRAEPLIDLIPRTPVDDLPQLAQDICNLVWWYD